MGDAFLAEWWREEAKRDGRRRHVVNLREYKRKHPEKVGICKVCGKERVLPARGLCSKCYKEYLRKKKEEEK